MNRYATFIILFAIAKWILFVQTQIVPSARIVGGSTTTIASAPYLVNIRANGQFICAGSLISSLYVVTAAHCVSSLKPKNLIVIGGATFLTDLGIRRGVQKFFIPQSYRSRTMHADVALLKLSAELKGNNIETIELCNTNWNIGDMVQVFGWGQVKENDYKSSNQLRTMMVPLIAHTQCVRQYQRVAKITNTMFCASKAGLKDACDGDSGGPVIYKNQLCGIVSWGIGCARRNYPGVYTNIKTVKKFIKNSMSK